MGSSVAAGNRRASRLAQPVRRLAAERRRFAARIGGLAVAALVVVIFLASVPAGLAYLGTPCAVGACDGPQLGPERVRMLHEQGYSLDFYARCLVAVIVIFAAVHLATAALIAGRRPDEPQALFTAITLLTFGLVTFPGLSAALVASHPAWRWPVAAAGYLGQVCLLILFYLFPDGRFAPWWTRWAALIWAVLSVPVLFFPGSPLDPHRSTLTAIPMYVGFFGSAVFAQAHRYRHVSTRAQRQQTKWAVYGFSVAVAGFLGFLLFGALLPRSLREGVLGFLGVQAALYTVMLLIPLSLAVAALRYRLWDIDPLINRTLVYGLLTAAVVGIYVLVVGYLGALFRTDSNLLVSLLATGLIAALVHPLRDRVQRGVNHLMYGERDEPYAVLSRLGQRLEATLAPEAVLPAVVQTVKEALKLPYAAIALGHGGGPAEDAASGAPADDLLRLPLTYRGETVGALLLAPRAAGESFSPTDRRLLEDIARQAGVAAHAVHLTADLRRSNENLQAARERLVTTREEERRRLRRDLHDGLGAQLAALTVQAGVLRSLIARDPAAADAAAVELRTELRAAIGNIRQLVHELRPPALDELGLVAALRQLASRYASSGAPDPAAGEQGVHVIVEAPDDLPRLPAAVEVAAYRIAQEALTNVVRHARARACLVRLAVSDALELTVTDDGVGLPRAHAAGVGLLSMRERATELGGSCVVEPEGGGGTRVSARIPLTKG